jgi:DUF1680 family protein
MELIRQRLVGPGFPEYTPEFVLADVKLDPDYPRLYDSFSGDISGRYLEALALVPGQDPAGLDALLRELLTHQRPDGRFGDAGLSFAADEIGKPQMALLWGNGRLLVGLLTYAQQRKSAEALEAARRLGDFLVRVRQECSAEAVAARLHGLGAHGLICFTQLIEGLAILGSETGDAAYLEAAREIAPLLPPPGIQHTHGYLSTLRGILFLYEATGDTTLLEGVEAQFDALLRSPDYVVYGGVLEFFGAETHGLSPADLKKLEALDNKAPQDEGCSEADFVRLGLQLWRATGKAEHLERAERCLLNHFYCNQFHSGDFGHRVVYHRGFRPSENPGKAWWCCNMHGLRTFPDVAEAIVTESGERVCVNLFLECDHSGERLAFRMANAAHGNGVVLTVTRDADEEVPLAVRVPSWATQVQLVVNGEAVSGELAEGYLVVTRAWWEGDTVEVTFTYREYVQLRSGEQVDLPELGAEPVEAALFCGPWLLGVHQQDEPAFLERPWTWGAPNENLVTLPERLQEARVDAARTSALPEPGVAVRLPYRHGGWPGEGEVTLRPISCHTACKHEQVLAVWITFRPHPALRAPLPNFIGEGPRAEGW